MSVGYFVAGWTGAAMALAASSLPPLVMVPATVVARRLLMTSWFAGFVRGASLATAGLLLSTGVSLIAPTSDAVTWSQVVIALVAVAVTYQGRLHPGLVVIGGALAGVALAR